MSEIPPASTEPVHYPDYPDICGSIRSMANAVSNLGVVTKPASQIRIEKRLWEIADSLEKRYKEDRARGPVVAQQAPAIPTFEPLPHPYVPHHCSGVLKMFCRFRNRKNLLAYCVCCYNHYVGGCVLDKLSFDVPEAARLKTANGYPLAVKPEHRSRYDKTLNRRKPL